MRQNSITAHNSAEEYQSIFEAVSEAFIIYDLETGRVVEANPAACDMYGYPRQEFVGLDPAVFMQPDSFALFQKQLHAVEHDPTIESLVIHQRKDGTPFHAEVRRTKIIYHGQPRLLGAIRDVSQRILTEKILSEEIEARRREQASLLSISHTLASTLKLQPGLILDQLHEIISFDHGGLFAVEDSSLITLATRGTQKLEQSAPLRIPLPNAETLVALFNDHKPIRIVDIWGENPQANFLRSLLNNGAAALLDGMRSWMWVPLAVKGRIIGGIGIAETSKDYFSSHHADLALSVADQAAITMINAELYGHAQALAVLEERQRLARSLHDAVNQSLFSAGLIAEVLPRLWERDQALARRSLEDLRILTRGALAEMRALLAELRPSTLTDSKLGDLLHLLGNAFTGRTNIPVIVMIKGEASLPAETQVALYRICQEALNNVAKHAKATKVEIDLRHAEVSEPISELRIRDNGRGFDPGGLPPSGHYGLGMMRERAEAAGVTLSITSMPGKGSEITVQWKKKEL